jgi:hypothetical protein
MGVLYVYLKAIKILRRKKKKFAVAGIKSQKLKYANALANLPKQVLS